MSCNEIKHSHVQDRMSDLSDSIIRRILSFLDAKDAVRSGILSKRFGNVWTEAPCLNFEQSTLQNVNNTLSFHNRSNLQKVSAIKTTSHCPEIELPRLFQLLKLAKVKELVLELNTNFSFPLSFYWNLSPKRLTKTNGCLNDVFIWESLQSLSLTKVNLDGESIDDIISGCPSIELLVLSECYISSRIDLTNNVSLRKLVIDNYCRYNKLELFAPNLQSLVLSGETRWSKFELLNVNSLIDCSLDFYLDMEWSEIYRGIKPIVFDGSMLGNHFQIKVDKLRKQIIMIQKLTSFLDDLPHIEAVTVGKWVLQILSLMELDELSCPMSKTIMLLKVRSNFSSDDMTGVAYLLRNLNLLEKLVIEIRDYDQSYFVPCFPKEPLLCLKKSFWSSEIMENLKTVEIRGLSEDQNVRFPYDPNEILLLVEFLLKKAKFLENMTVMARGSAHYLKELKDKLVGFPRSSPCAVVKIIDC